MRLAPWIVDRLACPYDGLPLGLDARTLRCSGGHRHRIVDGIPILLREDVEHPHWHAWQALQAPEDGYPQPATEGIDPYVQEAISATGGHMYASLTGRLADYPIPRIRLPPGVDRTLLDVGCNWGRWSIAGARAGYRVVGIDPSLPAVQAAYRVARQLGVSAWFLVADARFLPFADHTFDAICSYSVLQHLPKDDVRRTLTACARVLVPEGRLLVQMPNAFGIRSLQHQMRRRFREARLFQVRYWTPRELQRTFESLVGPATLSIDGFFTLNAQPAEAHLLLPRYRAVVRLSEMLRSVGRHVPLLRYLADSLYVESRSRP